MGFKVPESSNTLKGHVCAEVGSRQDCGESRSVLFFLVEVLAGQGQGLSLISQVHLKHFIASPEYLHLPFSPMSCIETHHLSAGEESW